MRDCKSNNNEEYKKVIKARMNLMALIFVLGSIMIIVSLVAKTLINDEMIIIYSSFGIGLVVVSALKWRENKFILGNEERLKQSRVYSNDERIIEINSKALKVSGLVLLISVYLVALIGGIFYPILAKALLSMACIFIVTHFISYKIYDKKM
ncbi:MULTISPECIES: hypothetical protein [Clostridium]|uniref:hypothetical protein n=1 Tax=Clostridium TaxID=1485 RepID=UPI0013FAD3CE|nr:MULTISPECIES: hypothetical protein [Clostridium]MBY6809215.1 hypothetical protein [Clostridium botulinum]MBY6822657.1 hypothetical protein [Clostridium botulinum]MBY6833269.1 hypothetical protein [Clostridium botulinum]MBY6971330.1 hypothetical protein [Clostridium botulinum]MCS6102802.1 hypothetical protein [Clostridium botulinum]